MRAFDASMWRESSCIAAFSLFVLLLASVMQVGAQERFGTISGTVTDSTKAPMVGVKVSVTNRSTSRVSTTTTGGDGSYILRGLEPGTYMARFENAGFTTAEVPGISLTAGAQLQVNTALTVGATTETIEVTDSAPLIDVSSARIAHNVTAEEFDRLPKGRSFQALALTSTSVNSGKSRAGSR